MMFNPPNKLLGDSSYKDEDENDITHAVIIYEEQQLWGGQRVRKEDTMKTRSIQIGKGCGVMLMVLDDDNSHDNDGAGDDGVDDDDKDDDVGAGVPCDPWVRVADRDNLALCTTWPGTQHHHENMSRIAPLSVGFMIRIISTDEHIFSYSLGQARYIIMRM